MQENLPKTRIPFKKVIIIWIAVLALATGGFFAHKFYFNTSDTISNRSPAEIANIKVTENPDDEFEGIIPNGEEVTLTDQESEEEALAKSKNPKDPANKSSNFNILVLGIDRRYAAQTSWRTDVIQLITFNADRTRAVATHIPRDVWADNYKINAIYNLRGPEEMKDIVEEVTGQRPDRIIRIDFDAFAWMVDAVGGLTIDVPNGFTDESYPQDREGLEGAKTVTFEEGEQTMDGEEALIYVRSRKGTNGEGSDYARGLRQQLVMEAIIDDFFEPDNIFKPKTAKTLYDIATQKVYTDMSVKDADILFEILKNYKNIEYESLGLSTANYLVVPADRAAYGGAWTLIAKNGDYTPIHSEIERLLNQK